MAHTLTRRGTSAWLRSLGQRVLPLRLAAVACLAAYALSCSAPCRAQQLSLPIDLEQGLVFGADRPRTPYLFSARVTPSVDVERVRFGVVLGPMYRNPRWDFALGARMGWFVPLAARDAGVRFILQGEYLPRDGVARASIGIVGELFGLVRLGLWPAYDFSATQPELCVGIGWDLASWARVLGDDL